MNRKLTYVLLPAVGLLSFAGQSNAGTTIDEKGVLVCVNDKWEEKEIEKGHKIADYAGPCVSIPDDPAAEKFVEDCVGKYEFMPDESWKGSGTCTLNLKGGHVSATWEEGSHLKEYTYTYTGGDGTYKGASGGGTYTTESLTDRFGGGRFKGKMELP
jgi:hypothetical protein